MVVDTLGSFLFGGEIDGSDFVPSSDKEYVTLTLILRHEYTQTCVLGYFFAHCGSEIGVGDLAILYCRWGATVQESLGTMSNVFQGDDILLTALRISELNLNVFHRTNSLHQPSASPLPTTPPLPF